MASTVFGMSSERKITTMNVSLPLAQKQFVDQQVEKGSFASVSDYIRDLIRREQRTAVSEQLEQQLLDGIRSGKPTAMTERQWAKLRAEVRRRRG